jgi:glycosyltransferase involved in cell wall biosynthesis
MSASLTIALCTYNRAPMLQLALDSLRMQTLPRSEFEILVIDNASTDDTAAVVETALRGGLPLRYVLESELGLSHARNRAVGECRSPYIAFLDDDAIAHPGWAAALLSSFGLTPRPAAVGGPILPIWEIDRPAWLSDALCGCLTILEGDRPSGYLATEHDPQIFGANMAMDHRILAAHGGFDPSLGRVGTRLLSGEEVLLFRRMQRAGQPLYFNAQAIVRHHVPKERLTKAWMYQRHVWGGVSLGVTETRFHGYRAHQRLWRVLKLLRVLPLREHVRGLFDLRDPQHRFASRCLTLMELARLYGLLGVR